jgi:hypothetical protein
MMRTIASARSEGLDIRRGSDALQAAAYFASPFGGVTVSSAGELVPRQAWSLWDMMGLKADTFYRAMAVLRETKAIIEPWQNQKLDSDFKTSEPIDDETAADMKGQAQRLLELLKILGTRVTKMAVDEHLRRLNSKGENPSYDDILKAYVDIDNSLRRELSLIDLLVLTGETAKYFEPEEPLFGEEFAAKFNTRGTFELEEAGKCVALDRSTAAAFHLMRIMEIGVQAFAKCLGISDPTKPVEKNWGFILERIWKDGIEKKWPNGAARMSGDGALFDELYASLDAVKNPWRNGTMHVEKKYTPEEAIHIYSAVRGFMMRLADRMDENGLPIA